jgi:site-specific DNA-methyltransferase (adenine-specific)
MLGLNNLYCMDCMDGMRDIPDKYFHLAIVDPPYGSANTEFKGGDKSRFGGRFDRYKKAAHTGGSLSSKYGKSIIDWDVAPTPEYFVELFRISQNQIIWGGNYFSLPPCRCFVVWDKLNIGETFSMAMCEYAWTNFSGNAKIIKMTPQGRAGKERIHPTEKPVALYEKLLAWYAKPSDKILDTHVGSASSLIACYRAGYDFMGFEIDEHYYRAANERLQAEMAQIRIGEM